MPVSSFFFIFSKKNLAISNGQLHNGVGTRDRLSLHLPSPQVEVDLKKPVSNLTFYVFSKKNLAISNGQLDYGVGTRDRVSLHLPSPHLEGVL
jgi:hypothetical protein